MDPARIDRQDPAWAAALERRHGPVQGAGAWRRLLPAIAADVASQPLITPAELRRVTVPTLLLIGRREVVWNPVTALRRARQLFPDIQAELVPNSSHEMCFSQREFVDARVRQFLNSTRPEKGEPHVLVSAAPADEYVGSHAG